MTSPEPSNDERARQLLLCMVEHGRAADFTASMFVLPGTSDSTWTFEIANDALNHALRLGWAEEVPQSNAFRVTSAFFASI
jgi:hypothetical protein